MTVTAKVNLHLLDNNRVARTFSALTRDISLTGVGLLQAVALSSNQTVVLGLPRQHPPAAGQASGSRQSSRGMVVHEGVSGRE